MSSIQDGIRRARENGVSDEDIASQLAEMGGPNSQKIRSALSDPSVTAKNIIDMLAGPREVPTQRIRAMAQGVSLGGSDEIEAFARSLGGETYDQAASDIRGKLKAYREARPVESLSYEMGGAVLPAFGAAALTTATGGAAAPALIPTMGRLAGLGALQGGVTAFNTSEGGLGRRAAAVPGGMAEGAVLAPVLGGAVKVVGGTAGGVVDFARRKFGDRGAKVAETELQRIADTTGLSVEQIVQKIANGEIMAENATIRDIVRGYARSGDQAASVIRGPLERRPDELQRTAVGSLQEGLSQGQGSVARRMASSDEAAKKLENRLYKSAFEQGGVMNADMMQGLQDALRRSPESINNINTLYRAQTGKQPFFRLQDGDIVFDRAPTLQDAEVIRPGIQTSVDEAFRSGRGAVGGALKDVEGSLRTALDESSPALQRARGAASNVRTVRDQYQAGQRAFTGSADQVALDFETLVAKGNQPAIQAYRSGVMDMLRNKIASGNKTTTIKNLADPDRKEGMILRAVFPGDKLDEVLGQLGRATQSRQAAGTILGGSGTAPTMLAAQQQGSRMAVGDVVGASSGDPMAMLRLGKNLMDKISPKLSEKDRIRIAQVLVSEDPAVVRRALTDNSALAALQKRVQQLTQTLAFTTGGTGAIMAAEPAGLLSQPFFSAGAQ